MQVFDKHLMHSNFNTRKQKQEAQTVGREIAFSSDATHSGNRRSMGVSKEKYIDAMFISSNPYLKTHP